LKEELTKLDSAEVIPVELDGGTPELDGRISLELKVKLASVDCMLELEKIKLVAVSIKELGTG
jgi:hypothetical protein